LAFALRDEGLRRRAVSAVLVVLLHGLLLLALVHALIAPQPRMTQSAREIIFHLLPRPAQPRAQTAAPQAEPSPQLPHRIVPVVAPPLPATPAPNIQGLGQSLFGCALEDLGKLTPDQRAHCSTGALARPDDSVVAQDKSHVKDPARRAAEMAAKNRNLRVPCTGFSVAQTPYGNVTVPSVNPLCLAKGLMEGFGPLNGLEK